jgi:hypothetical protein
MGQGNSLLNYYGDTRYELVINGHSWWNLGVNDEQTMKLLYDELLFITLLVTLQALVSLISKQLEGGRQGTVYFKQQPPESSRFASKHTDLLKITHSS